MINFYLSRRRPKYRGPVADATEADILTRKLEVARNVRLPRLNVVQPPITKRDPTK